MFILIKLCLIMTENPLYNRLYSLSGPVPVAAEALAEDVTSDEQLFACLMECIGHKNEQVAVHAIAVLRATANTHPEHFQQHFHQLMRYLPRISGRQAKVEMAALLSLTDPQSRFRGYISDLLFFWLRNEPAHQTLWLNCMEALCRMAAADKILKRMIMIELDRQQAHSNSPVTIARVKKLRSGMGI